MHTNPRITAIGITSLMLTLFVIDPSSSQVQARDSAGVTIVENTGGLWEEGEGWTLSEEPAVTIGMEEGLEEYSLYRVRGALQLPDGTIVIANGGTGELRYYDSAGTFLYSVGNVGNGPGEFTDIWGMWRCPDTLVVADRLRTSLFSSAGEYGRTLTLDQQRSDFAPARADGVFADCSILGATMLIGDYARPGKATRNNSVYRRYSRDGVMLDSLGVFFVDEFVRGQLNTRTNATTGMVTATAVYAAAPFGRRASTIASGDYLYHGSSDSYEIKVFAKDGRLRRIVRGPIQINPVTDRDKELFRDHLAERGDQGARRVLRNLQFPDTKPAYGNVTVDVRGHIWVAEYSIGSEDRSGNWTVFDVEGRMLGNVRVPQGGRFIDIGEDYLIGVWRTELDVEQVRMYRLVRN